MKLWRVTVNGEELHFMAETLDEAEDIIRSTLPQSDVDWLTLEEDKDAEA